MSYHAAEALRAAGVLTGTVSTELEQFYATLTKDEADVLISVTSRLNAVLPDVVAHEWSRPESGGDGLDAAMLCQCGQWTGAGGAL